MSVRTWPYGLWTPQEAQEWLRIREKGVFRFTCLRAVLYATALSTIRLTIFYVTGTPILNHFHGPESLFPRFVGWPLVSGTLFALIVWSKAERQYRKALDAGILGPSEAVGRR